MRGLFCICIILCLYSKSYAQGTLDFSEMLKNAEQVLFSQPDQSRKIVLHILQNSERVPEKIEAYLLQARSHYIQGDYHQTVRATLEAKKLAESTNNLALQLKINVFGIHVLNNLGLDLAAEKYHEFTEVIVSEHQGNTNDPLLKAGVHLINAETYKTKEQYDKSVEELLKAQSIFHEIQATLPSIETEVKLIEIQLNSESFEGSKMRLEEIITNYSTDPSNAFVTMIANNELGALHFSNKLYNTAIDHFLKALNVAEQLPNKVYQERIVDGLALSYMALEDSDKFYVYKQVGNDLSVLNESDEANAVNAVFNYTSENHTNKKELVKNEYSRNIMILGGLLVLGLFIGRILQLRYRSRISQYQDFLNYFEIRQQEKESQAVTKKEISRSTTIPKETEEQLLKKLTQFENSDRFTKKDMSLAAMASLFDTNTKYLSEIINTHKEQNFNSYINELRINYIIDKLHSNPTYTQYKISYLAEESGFTSHSSFATVFKSVTGIPPTVFIDLVKSKQKKVKATEKELHHA